MSEFRPQNSIARQRGAVAAQFPPSQLPVPVKTGASRALVLAKRIWILHRLAIIRVGMALVVALVLAAGFQARGGITQAVMSTGDIMAGRFASAGFGIDEIAITGLALTRESDVAMALGIDDGTNSFNFDVDAARLRILELPSVSEVSVRKIYPSRLIVEIEESVAVARWRVDGATFLVDARGVQIADASSADSALPLVIGDGAADDALMIIRAIERHPGLSDGLLAFSRIADRRWDMIYDTGLRVQLPEMGLGQALAHLENAQTTQQLLERDLVLIDMRVAGKIAVRLAERELAERELAERDEVQNY